jgi:hypothetical protein
MYSLQKGLLPFLTRLFGVAILVYPTAIVLFEAIANLIKNHALIDFAATFIAAIVVLLFPVWVGLLLLKMFPSIRVTPNGIKYSSAGFLKGTTTWNEIEELLLFDNGYMAIAFQKPGFFLINGAYFYKLYGLLVRHQSNILFLSPKISNKEEILESIFQNTQIKVAKRVRR